MLYWRYRCNFSTVCWSAIGCEWGRPLFTLGLPMFALSLEYFLTLPWGPSTHIDFLFMWKISFEWHKKSPPPPPPNSLRSKTWMAFVEQILFKLEMSSRFSSVTTWCHVGSNLCKHAGGRSVHYDVIKWKHFPRYWPFVRGIHRSPVNSSNKGQWRRALMFSLIFTWINGWVNNLEVVNLRRHRAHYDVTVMDHGSAYLTCLDLYGMEVWKFSGAICAMMLNKISRCHQG